MKKEQREVFRSAETGQFVTEEKAAQNPNETVKETIEVPVKPHKHFDLEIALKAISERITPEMREEDEKFQIEMRASAGSLIDPNSPAQRIARARQSETALLEEIAFVSQAEESELKQNRLFSLLNRLSEVLAEQGKYFEAVEVCPEQQRRDYFQKVLDAIDKSDSETCACDDSDRIRDQRTGASYEAKKEVQVLDIVTETGETKRLAQCRKCGFLNAR